MADITEKFRNRQECNKALIQFSNEHLTFINQIFGDQTVRSFISNLYPNKDFKFKTEKTGREFDYSYHHFLASKNKITPYKEDGVWIDRDIICSVKSNYQNMNINKNDTLCQSYSLLTFLGQPIDPDQMQRQMDMIEMYRSLLENTNFVNKLKEIIVIPKNSTLWTDFRQPEDPFLKMDPDEILREIHETLDKWEVFGFYYFIGNGKCPESLFPKKSLLEEESIPEEEEDENMSRRLRSRIVGGKKSNKKSKSKSKTNSKSKSKSKSKINKKSKSKRNL